MCAYVLDKKGYICKMLPVDVLAPSSVCDTNLSGDCVYPTHGDHNGDHSGWGDLAMVWLRRAGVSYDPVITNINNAKHTRGARGNNVIINTTKSNYI